MFNFEKTYPYASRWAKEYGRIEIGQDVTIVHLWSGW